MYTFHSEMLYLKIEINKVKVYYIPIFICNNSNILTKLICIKVLHCYYTMISTNYAVLDLGFLYVGAMVIIFFFAYGAMSGSRLEGLVQTPIWQNF